MPASDNVLMVYTIRHAPVDLGKQKIIAGRLDPPLNADGTKMINLLKASTLVPSFDILVTSPLKRAFDTARQLTDIKDEDVTVSRLCAERSYGKLEGVPPDALGAIKPKTFYVAVGGIDYSLNPPDGETLEELRGRAASFHDFIKTLQGQRVLVVSHEAFLQQYHGLLRGLDVYHALAFPVRYLEINRFSFKGNRQVFHEQVHQPEQPYEHW